MTRGEVLVSVNKLYRHITGYCSYFVSLHPNLPLPLPLLLSDFLNYSIIAVHVSILCKHNYCCTCKHTCILTYMYTHSLSHTYSLLVPNGRGPHHTTNCPPPGLQHFFLQHSNVRLQHPLQHHFAVTTRTFNDNNASLQLQHNF